VQVSDVHVGPFFGERELSRAEELVRGLRPDLVVMTGDLVHLRRADVAPGVAWLARLARMARHGATAIVGNHEYYVGRDFVLDAMRAAKIDVLFNEGRVVAPNDGGGFSLVGTDDLLGPLLRRGPGPDVARALLALPPDAARILLCHQPQFHETAATYGFDLQLSGHTHGGQIAPLGPIVGRAVFRHVAGLSAIGDSRLYVNRGLGTSGPPTRVAVRPEITKVVLVAG
jgi:predicted MPP superfamily phosphohydrolase